MIVGKWITRFSETGKKEEFQLDGEAPTTIAVMKQNHYPVKMGIDSDLGCTVKKKKKKAPLFNNEGKMSIIFLSFLFF